MTIKDSTDREGDEFFYLESALEFCQHWYLIWGFQFSLNRHY